MEIVHNPTHQVLVCRRCQTCVGPLRRSVERHLRAEPHRLQGQTLQKYLESLDGLRLRSLDELKKARGQGACEPIDHLKLYNGYRCLLCKGLGFFTIHLPRMRDHMPLHNRKAKEHGAVLLWEECLLQTYFTGKGRIDYFVVIDDSKNSGAPVGPGTMTTRDARESELFEKMEKEYLNVTEEVRKEANVVHDFGNSRSARIPWLERTGFPNHLAGLMDDEVKGSYRIPPRESGDTDFDTAAILQITSAADEVLRDAYALCSDTSPHRKMTQQRANILNKFYDGGVGRGKGFRYYKNQSTLAKYFTTFKRLLAYYYRVVHCDEEHFTRTSADQVLPGDTITPTTEQRQAMDDIMRALDDNDQAQLKHAVRQLYLALICHVVGSTPFKSPVLSFCAMLSRKPHREEQGKWEEPGNYNSHLSALTWAAQLIMFDWACLHEKEDEDQIPVFLETICAKFFRQQAETPFGHILQWRVYLFEVSRAAIVKHQARWSLDGQTVVYRGLELQLSYIPQLVVSEYQQAQTLLYDELMFKATDLTRMESWRLQDDLDLEDYGGSWLSHHGNSELLRGAELALFRHIQGNAELRAMFLKEAKDERMVLCPKAMAIYESYSQEFLKRVLVLCHIPAGQPLREPELLSVTWRNTARPRHIFMWEKLVMIYTQYHKGQQQSGVYKDNVRFLPRAIGDLLLDYVAYVLPLRQMFLRHHSPNALISPYLWAKLDGTVWADGTLSACLSRACARAQVPRLHTSNWRQISASICKEKFSTKERGYFDLEESRAEEMEDELELVALAEQSNHAYRTFNHSYAGSTTLTMNTLLHRNHRASESWHQFFRFDQLLEQKRPTKTSTALSLHMLDASRRQQVRRRAAYSEANLTAVARRILGVPDLHLRIPGQRDGMLAVMGPRPAEQVVIVIGTGSGKSLIFMVGASVADARTTILVLPMVALRVDMLRRFHQVGIRPSIWPANTKESASVVIVSAEAACTQAFLEYAHLLVSRQELDRIVVDECHLTITASDYRPCMAQLGWYIRQIRTQTVWLTATLPPAMEEGLVEHNRLVRPRMVRESTNRRNIKYMVSIEKGPAGLVEAAAALVEACWPQEKFFNHSRDKIIMYCHSLKDVASLADILSCPTYTSRSGNEEEKAAIIAGWLGREDQPVIIATAALGIGFDYPFIRLVVHVGAPEKLTDFAQESGRAGRDGQKASSIVMLRSTWKPQLSGHLGEDEEAMQLYLTQRYCSRGILTQFLDAETDWRWCMTGEECCQVCNKPRREPRPAGLRFSFQAEPETVFTGPAEVLRQDYVHDQVLDRYEKELELMVGSCLYCRVGGRQFDHRASACPRRSHWINAKADAYQTRKREGKGWIARYVACWKCYQPQEVCHVADPEHEETECKFPDMVMPLCYGVYYRPGRDAWFHKHFQKRFRDQLEYMLWLGEAASMGGSSCIQANCVAAVALEELR